MAFYRATIQYGIGMLEAPDGFYWCTQVWYFNADTDAEYAHAREGAIRITSEWLNVNVLVWDLWIRFWPSGALVEHSAPQWPHPVLSGPYDYPTVTAFASLRSGGRQVSYKRIRSPLRGEDYTPDGLLTASALAYYQSVADLVADYACFTNEQGVAIEDAVMSPHVHNWQLRHGTKRRWRRLTA